MSLLGPPPEKLSPLPRQFFGGLVALLDVMRPPLLDTAMTKATPREDGVEIVLAHSAEIAFSVWVQAERDTILVGCSAMHEQRADPAEALVIVAELLCGRREISGYDGRRLLPDFGAQAAPSA